MSISPPEPRTTTPTAQVQASPPETYDSENPDFDQQDSEPRPLRLPSRKRVLTVLGVLIVLAALVTLPPLINLNRYRKQVTTSIGASLGRPVHVGNVTLAMLPVPGLTITDFYVSEDPAFGAEPVIYARSVQARIRLRSLWGRHLEFSRITFEEPSVNLVHRADGKWNLESILLSASRVAVAPTAQRGPGDVPRFPYIDATNARLNLKLGNRKMPLSLTEARFSLWLPDRGQWHLRLEAHPTRTDAAAMDTGLVRLEGTLGKAPSLQAVPLNLHASWTGAPLGAVSWVLLGRDAGLRGDLTLTAALEGTAGASTLDTQLQLAQLRRADFVPAQTLAAGVDCTARVLNVFHALDQLRCTSPGPTPGSGVTLTGAAPDLFQPTTYTGEATATAIPLSLLAEALHVASTRVAPGLTAAGSLSAHFTQTPAQGLAGTLDIPQATLSLEQQRLAQLTALLSAEVQSRPLENLVVKPVNVDLGGASTLEIDLGWQQSTLHLTGFVLRSRLLTLAQALPQLGDNLEPALPPASSSTPLPELPVPVDLLARYTPGKPPIWTAALPPRPLPRKRKHR